MNVLPLSYDPVLIFLSIIVVLISAFIALNISGMLFATIGKARIKWILLGALVMGLGIWSMHFIGMLASHLSMEVAYNTPLVITSILPALFASGIAFAIISKPQVRKTEVLAGAVLITTGIVAMHYTGMAAMQMQATIQYNPLLWLLSVVVALAASLLAMFLLYYSRNRQELFGLKAASAALIALGVSGMHYIGMAAASFEAVHDHPAIAANSMDNNYIAYNVGIGMALILMIAILSIRSETKVKSLSDEYDRQFLSVIESATDGIVVTDAKGFVMQWNYGAECLFGYSKEEITHQDVRLVFPQAHQNMDPSTDPAAIIGKTIELMGLKKGGSQFPVELSTGTWETARGAYYSLIVRDITDRRASEEKISNLVYLDSLTGLPNRRLFNDRLDSSLSQALENNTVLTVLYLDLDQFKMVNDTYGHHTGDQLLVEVADRIQSCITKTDTLARLGGDEFILLLPNADYEKAEATAQKILEVLNNPFLLNNEAVFTTPSIGAALYPADGKDSETLVKNADIAMYRVKDEGKNHFQFFTSEMNDLVSRKSKIAMSIRKGLELGEFTVRYQPQFDIESEKIIGVEALVRWHHTKWGPISPAEFIPIAEENGMILHIGEFVLRTACQQNKDWQDAGLPPFRVAVNISAKQFSNSNIAAVVTSALADAGLSPEFLELELTESIIQGARSAISKMWELKAMGIHLSIDDFGTGYSSLSYLKLFPVDTLKIDQHFTRNIHNDPKDAALVDTIIQMAHNLELNVIAEGVETSEQLAFLKKKKCNQAQGYYFQKPLLPDQIEKLYLKA
ncbi:diguanylate cyclase (GGDEF)-like protein/PAS domain S-box-containing protein [Planomicrobium stackebrandtii]|uniref:Diguanylate cyclase (GGDEF)-like protein/PAS domain S-box-containing protein n=2 Tax=Planomicrobium stackebrandtii TaxID=253160 RepID=A0ABU0GU08_9BACL|nr:diguanylate cyclase (GGDEF)-like protein/PAS domain S-box-containing protein [Planomicrobium stackebrandtii]